MEGLQLSAVQERDCLYNKKVVFLVYVLRWAGWKERKKEGKKKKATMYFVSYICQPKDQWELVKFYQWPLVSPKITKLRYKIWCIICSRIAEALVTLHSRDFVSGFESFLWSQAVTWDVSVLTLFVQCGLKVAAASMNDQRLNSSTVCYAFKGSLMVCFCVICHIYILSGGWACDTF